MKKQSQQSKTTTKKLNSTLNHTIQLFTHNEFTTAKRGLKITIHYLFT